MSIVIVEHTRAVMTVTLNRPGRLNALIPDTFRELRGAWDRAAEPDVRAIVLTGAGRGFCAGADVSAPRDGFLPGSQMLEHFFNPAIVEMAALDKPIIAAINGPVAGAGLSLASLADIRIASHRAHFVPGFIDAGLAPDTGASLFLLRALGYSETMRFLGSGRTLSAEDALRVGLVSEVVGHEVLMASALALAENMAAKPAAAMSATKRLLRSISNRELDHQLRLEAEAYRVTSKDDEQLAARSALVKRMAAGASKPRPRGAEDGIS